MQRTDMDRAKERSIRLEYPVQLADRLLEEVTMRRPLMGDMARHNLTANSSVAQEMALMADLCDLAPDEIALMDTTDFEKLQDQLLRFRGVPLS